MTFTDTDNLPALLLSHWSRTRGPLFDDPVAAASRILAYAACDALCRGARDPWVRSSAAATLRPHTLQRPSKSPAAPRNRQKAYELLQRIRRFAEAAGQAGAPLADLLHGELCAASARCEPLRRIELYGRAMLLAHLLCDRDERTRLQCARALLRATYSKARRVGYGKRTENSGEQAGEELEASGFDLGCNAGARPASPRTVHPQPTGAGGNASHAPP